MTDLRIAGLCSGTGALEMAVQEVLGGSVIWHCQYEPPDKDGKPDKWQYAARILAHHWPDVPNLGDITAVDWSQVEPPHVLAMGFPCTDVSSAGLRAGIAEGTRSGVWFHCVRAIKELRPKLVVIENVEGLLSAKADRGVGPTDPDVEAAGPDALRALGCVLGDLADLGYDTEWCRVAASRVGAPHRRYRIIILAWTAAYTHSDEPQRWGIPGVLGSTSPAESGQGHQRERAGHPAGHRGPVAADSADLGHERGRSPRDGRSGSADGRLTPADAHGDPAGHDRELPAGRHPVQQRLRDDAAGRRPSPPTDADLGGLRAQQHNVCTGQPDADWGAYGPAIRRWEHILGRPAPRPTDDRGRLAAAFVEWMMGLPVGHVTDVPAPEGMTPAGLRNARLKALGNGVVPQQAAYALRLLLDRAGSEVAA